MVKKYKLIKEYPNSVKLGTIVETNEYDYLMFNPGTDNVVGIYPGKHPEYWKEIVEKEYEILSVKKIKKLDNLRAFDEWTPTKNYGVSLEAMLNIGWCVQNGNYYINSVKRLSDGKIFTIGDDVKETYNKGTTGYKISEFTLKDTRCFACGANINYIEKHKEVELCVPIGTKFQHKDYLGNNTVYTVAERLDDTEVLFTWDNGADSVVWDIKFMNELFAKGTYKVYVEPVILFTTEDGVEITNEIGVVYVVDTVTFKIFDKKAINYKKQYDYVSYYKVFSTKKAAENYIKCNKPVLSYKDVLNLYDTLSHSHIRQVYKNELQKLVDSKLK